MSIQLYVYKRNFDVQKAERYFKERRIKYQLIDLPRYGMGPRELESVIRSVGLQAVIDENSPDAELLKYLAYDADKVNKLLENPSLIKTPIVRNGSKLATVGYCPVVWAAWE